MKTGESARGTMRVLHWATGEMRFDTVDALGWSSEAARSTLAVSGRLAWHALQIAVDAMRHGCVAGACLPMEALTQFKWMCGRALPHLFPSLG